MAELAGRAGMAPARLWRLLRGEREMRAVELVRLCAALDVELGDLASGGEEKRE